MPSVHLSGPPKGHQPSGPSSRHNSPPDSNTHLVPAKAPVASGTKLPVPTPSSHPGVSQPTHHPDGVSPKPSEPHTTGGGLPKPTTDKNATVEHPPNSTPTGDHGPHAPSFQTDCYVPIPSKLSPSVVGKNEPTVPQHPSATSAPSDIPRKQHHSPTSAPIDHDPNTPAPTHTGSGASISPEPRSAGPVSQAPSFILHSEPTPRPSVADHLKDIGWDMAGSLATGVIGAGIDIGAHAVENQIDQDYANANVNANLVQGHSQEEVQGQGKDQGQDQGLDGDTTESDQVIPPVQHAVLTHPTYSTGEQTNYDTTEHEHENGDYAEDWEVYDDYYTEDDADGEHDYDHPGYYPDDNMTGYHHDHYGDPEHDTLGPHAGYGDPSVHAVVGHVFGGDAMNQPY
ncbi:hypothetical protein G647_02503 [Cladophialophora carrionii CBS 160.54]|uniref:Uncharacterized protein n=1 Tax=Cladophialophora carrionii CBS 160.54 TaxID=1279043 RepID=V9DFR1_9EURO|nr:uncharacterized protein G647_02503 [Cladophialophora carrionii CBS 160.54]ETI25729.1 hypothetical protein G647_02503 [Cladophialophora carrionii CBS 160.54]